MIVRRRLGFVDGYLARREVNTGWGDLRTWHRRRLAVKRARAANPPTNVYPAYLYLSTAEIYFATPSLPLWRLN